MGLCVRMGDSRTPLSTLSIFYITLFSKNRLGKRCHPVTYSTTRVLCAQWALIAPFQIDHLYMTSTASRIAK